MVTSDALRAALLLDELEAAGLCTAARGGVLVVTPGPRLTPDQRRRLAACKPALLRLLAARRRPREWLFRRGDVVREPPPPEDDPRRLARGCWPWADDYHPGGALWWRVRGGPTWLPIPGRGGDGLTPPARKED